MLLPVPKPPWLEEKERNLPGSFVRNGSQLWVTWGGQHTFTAENAGRKVELLRIECPDPRLCQLSVIVQTDAAFASTITFDIQQGVGRVTSPLIVNVAKGAGVGHVNAIEQPLGRIIIVEIVNATPIVAGNPDVSVSGVIAPLIPWWGL